jgi:Family of unknown function (DUF6308)
MILSFANLDALEGAAGHALPMNPKDIRIGAHLVGYETAHGWVMEYFNAAENFTAKRPFAYPAYDDLWTGSGPDEVNDGDLLAPGMLNAPIDVAGLYALQRIRPRLKAALERTPETVTLTSAIEDGSLQDRMKSFFGVLDERRLAHVGFTKLTKILHRKRPKFVPIHDKFVRKCYVGGEGYPVHPNKNRMWADYASEMAAAMDGDIRRQFTTLEHLRADSGADVSTLRVLDVIAWNAGKPSLRAPS